MDGSNASVISRVVGNWTESTATWNNKPATTSANNVILPASTFSTQDYENIDVSNLVKDMYLDSTNSFGMMIQLLDETRRRGMYFASSDNANSSKHPKLVIYYQIPNSSQNINAYNIDFNLRVSQPEKKLFVSIVNDASKSS